MAYPFFTAANYDSLFLATTGHSPSPVPIWLLASLFARKLDAAQPLWLWFARLERTEHLPRAQFVARIPSVLWLPQRIHPERMRCAKLATSESEAISF